MKLLITTDNFLPRWDGIARFLNEILPRLKGYDITVIAPDYGPIKTKGYTLVQLPLGKKTYGDYTPAKFAYKKIRKLVAESDIIFNQTIGPIGICSILAAKGLYKPILSFTHSLEWELVPKALNRPWKKRLGYPFAKMFARFFYNRCTALVVPSAHTAEQLSWQGITPTKRIAHLGVDIEKFSPGSKKSARETLGLPADAYIIGYHGRIAHEKNLITLLRAFLRVDIPKKKLLIVGDGLEEIKEKLVRDDVIITGMQDDVRPYLQAMDVYVLSSFTETTSLSVLEAMAMGLPVISSRVGFIGDYIRDQKNGFFFNVRSAYDLAKKIRRLHALPQKEVNALRKEARLTIEKEFRWEMTAQAIQNALKEFS